MHELDEVEISKTIVCTYHERLLDRLASDVVIVGAGPSGLVAAYFLSQAGVKVTVLEKRLAPGGGIWGGGMGMSVAVVQEEAIDMLDRMGIRCRPRRKSLYSIDAAELASGLCWNAIQVGAAIFNMLTVEDLCLRGQRVTGVVVNRTTISGVLPVDPIVFSATATLDATGHEAVLVECLRKRGLLAGSRAAAGAGEGPMDATAGENFVVDNAGEIFPGLWLSGMSVAATLGGPRMGPIFGGMLLSGKRCAEAILGSLPAPPHPREPVP